MVSPYVMKEVAADSDTAQLRLAVLGVVACLGGGTLGLLLMPGFWFCAWCFQDARLSEISTLIAYVTMPLLFVGGCCLDWYETLMRKKP